MRCLVVKTSSLGDIIHAFPVIEYLHVVCPGVEVDWVVEDAFREIVVSHPLIHKVISIQSKRWRKRKYQSETYQEIKKTISELRHDPYDLVIDLQGNIKSGLVTFFAKSSIKIGFGWKSLPEKPNYLVTNVHYNPCSERDIREQYLEVIKSYFKDFNTFSAKGVTLKVTCIQQELVHALLADKTLEKGKRILVCPGSQWMSKQLKDETLISFLEQLKSFFACSFIFVWGNEKERILAEKLHSMFAENSMVLPRLEISVLQYLMTQIDLAIAVDSMPLHLCATTSTPTFSVFGPSRAAIYAPQGKQHYVIQGQCPYGKQFTKRCPILRSCETAACIRNLSSEQLFEEFSNWWKCLPL